MGNSNNTNKIIGALAVGAAVGAALGILFAPEKGSETRKKLASKGQDLSDAVKEKAQSLLEKFKEKEEMIEEKTNEFIAKGKAMKEQYKTS